MSVEEALALAEDWRAAYDEPPAPLIITLADEVIRQRRIELNAEILAKWAADDPDEVRRHWRAAARFILGRDS